MRRVGRWLGLIVSTAFAMDVGAMRAGAQDGDNLATLGGEVSRLHSQGGYAEALPIAERYLAIARRRQGEEHTEFATAIGWLGFFYQAQGRYAEAEPLYKRALSNGRVR